MDTNVSQEDGQSAMRIMMTKCTSVILVFSCAKLYSQYSVCIVSTLILVTNVLSSVVLLNST